MSSHTTPTCGELVLGYFGILALFLIPALLLDHFTVRFRGDRGVFLSVGIVCILIGSLRVPILFDTWRRAGWFRVIKSDAVMRAVLVVVGVFFFVAALWWL